MDLPPGKDDNYWINAFFADYEGSFIVGEEFLKCQTYVMLDGPSPTVNLVITRFMNWLKFGQLPEGVI